MMRYSWSAAQAIEEITYGKYLVNSPIFLPLYNNDIAPATIYTNISLASY